ncbi:WYL domain-containing protein [Paenibacillus sambharensis]|uniref:WYL domain-containing protein n=1 Tax=Paenibacillus sambharensis TaxID=1803190 RepID=A0A2W1L0S7_9BACL|nr:WYL domain-containing protein [Paenibacillus sambharensis]PZD92956.1 WYL domain-containing protein [Paenibacillus sambharensis]
MSLFEKIFNYGILSRLQENGIVPVTTHERSWLKTMLQHPTAADAFTPDTLKKLRLLLSGSDAPQLSGMLQEKAGSMEKQVYHPFIRQLRSLIRSGQGIRISYRIKDGSLHEEQRGYPYKLEYSMVKREWYLLWYRFRPRSFMATKLDNIISVSGIPLEAEQAETYAATVRKLLDSRRRQAVIEVVPEFNNELSRILYAFSCFDKSVAYEESSDTYQIRISYLADESEYVLLKIRFLGKRVRVVQNTHLQTRMRETAAKALARYGITGPDADADTEQSV